MAKDKNLSKLFSTYGLFLTIFLIEKCDGN
jgi:hypothetical protein